MPEGVEHLTHWLFMAAAIWILIAVAIPWPRLKRVWLPALLTGFLMSFPINHLAVGYLGMWRFPRSAWTIRDTPFFLALAWFGAMAVFDHLVLVYSRFRIIFIFGFSMLSTAIYAEAAIEGHLKPGHWSYAETYLLAVIMHSLSLLVLKLFVKDDRLRPDAKPLG